MFITFRNANEHTSESVASAPVSVFVFVLAFSVFTSASLIRLSGDAIYPTLRSFLYLYWEQSTQERHIQRLDREQSQPQNWSRRFTGS